MSNYENVSRVLLFIYYLIMIILISLVNGSPRSFSLCLFGFGWRPNARQQLMIIEFHYTYIRIEFAVGNALNLVVPKISAYC